MLAEKNIDAEIKLVDSNALPEDVLHLNPYQNLPTLIDRDLVLYDPNVIAEYLDERYPHPPFMPLDPVSRARSRLALYRIEKDWYSLVPALTSDSPNQAATARQKVRDSITASAELFSHKTFFLSDEYSMLDATLAPLLWRFNYYGIELSATAQAVTDYAKRVFERPQFRASLTGVEESLGG